MAVNKALLAAAFGAGALALSAVNSQAAIVCAGAVCRHTHEAYKYPPDARVIVHPDTWRWRPGEHFTWYPGRGYWRPGDHFTWYPGYGYWRPFDHWMEW
jgi:hypothetical protein